ncbi:MAG: hypothetical protein NPINA01_22790 [Nitrospinaceae bacterium]|nr:MAG: hypothetical protein NPINA01_22790 [Nitrospinaceae bacterium]
MYLNMESLVAGVVGIGAGVYWFFQGFRELQSSRTIQNIPTSRIMTGAVGTHVEIKGQIVSSPDKLLNAPISGQTCAFYSIEIQRLVKSKNHSYWKKIDQINSADAFSVDDGSGGIAQVFVRGADMQRQGKAHEFRIRSHDLLSMPELLISVLQRNEDKLKVFKLKNSSWLFSQKYRFVEWSFGPQESVYVLGYAESGIALPKKNKLKFSTYMQARKMIENDPRLQTRYDQNQDGILVPEELERGAQMLGTALQAEPVALQKLENTNKIKMLFKKRPGCTFLVSNIKEKDLIKKLSLKAALKVWGGPVVALAGAVYLLFMLNAKI